MAVRIRLKKMGRRHRAFFRICAMDSRTPRGGKVLEELGTYDPMLPETDARAILKADRIDYWLGVGAQPTEKVNALIKKYGTSGTHADRQKAAIGLLAQPKVIPDPGAPASLPKKPEPKPEPEAKAKAPAKAKTDAPAKAEADAKADAPAKAKAPADGAKPEATASDAAPETKSAEVPADAAPAEATPDQTAEDGTKVEKVETEVKTEKAKEKWTEKVAKTVEKMKTATKPKTEKEE